MTRTLRRPGRALALVVLLAAGAAAPAAAAPVTISDGHVDYGARLVGGALRSQVKDGTTSPVSWREPGDVRFRLTAAARERVPSGAAFGFLGAAGAPTWLIPQAQKPGVVWLGWNTEEPRGGAVDGPVTWSLDAVDGPGRVSVYNTGSFGEPTVLFDSGDGLPDTATVRLGTHAHGNWSFSTPGTYAREDRGGDPLDGLVNLFDLGIVLAVAFMLAALSSLRLADDGRRVEARPDRQRQDTVVVRPDQRVEPGTTTGGRAVGRGKAVGRVYELSDGRTIVVRDR